MTPENSYSGWAQKHINKIPQHNIIRAIIYIQDTKENQRKGTQVRLQAGDDI